MSEYVFKLPDLGEGTVESEIVEWAVQVGDVVEEEAVVGTMMTDKANIEISAPVSGRIVSLAGKPGDVIAVGAPLIVFETDAEPPQKTAARATVLAKAKADVPAGEPSGTARASAASAARIITSPAIRRRAQEEGIDLASVPGSGADGRILREDFDRFLKAKRAGQAPVASTAVIPPREREIPVIGLRRLIAERMAEANREAPHFSYVEEVDITELEGLRRHLNRKRADEVERLTLLPFIGLALIRALRDLPACNTTYDKQRNVLLRHGAVHLGIATQTPDGLKVPVVRHAERLSLEQLSAQIRRVSQAARDNTIRSDELSGSTITLTSLGKLGGIASTPIINLPEVAIVGVNRAVERPVIVNGQVAVRLVMNLSSSFDHRFVDGHDAASLIQRLREILEHPATLFMP